MRHADSDVDAMRRALELARQSLLADEDDVAAELPGREVAFDGD